MSDGLLCLLLVITWLGGFVTGFAVARVSAKVSQ